MSPNTPIDLVHPSLLALLVAVVALGSVAACTSPAPTGSNDASSKSTEASAPPESSPSSRDAPPDTATAPPPAIAAWMDRLTVAHEYDPKTGFIVAKETIPLPPIVAEGPSLEVAIEEAGSDRLVVAFATADRCAPCQQFKKDAINDAAVVATLSETRFLPTHVEVDESPELAERVLGSRGIPMTYALRDGVVVAQLRGQRSAADLLAWLDGL